MNVIIYRPRSSPLPIPNSVNSDVSFITYKDCEFIKYILDLNTFMECIPHFISESNLENIPQLIYLRSLPVLFKLTDRYPPFRNVYLLSESNGYYSDCLISNTKYIKPTNVNLGSANDLMAQMCREYKANRLMETL